MQSTSREHVEGSRALRDAQVVLSMVKQIFEIFITRTKSTSLFLYPAAVNTREELAAQISLTRREKKLSVRLSAKRMAVKDDWKLNLTI